MTRASLESFKRAALSKHSHRQSITSTSVNSEQGYRYLSENLFFDPDIDYLTLRIVRDNVYCSCRMIHIIGTEEVLYIFNCN